MYYLNETHILLFLLQVLVLLGVARTLSVICEAFKIPALVGEILAGILLGPTILGRVFPYRRSLVISFRPDTMDHAGNHFLAGCFLFTALFGFSCGYQKSSSQWPRCDSDRNCRGACAYRHRFSGV
jgi:hypothetical protein